ncbi:MAG: MAPEG family protein [Myxococcales bacterium]|nr:MAPEG family protein [Myxococcales bacterium]HIK84238.1 MAPEG family protein [Myxococcales bacterium]
MTTALICIALLGLLVFGLGFATSSKRRKTETLTGSSDDPTDALHKLVRAHGNTTEYAPMMAILILALGSMSPDFWMLCCMGVATASRYAVAAGLILSSSMNEAHPLRFIGALGTYLSGFGLVTAVLLSI